MLLFRRLRKSLKDASMDNYMYILPTGTTNIVCASTIKIILIRVKDIAKKRLVFLKT